MQRFPRSAGCTRGVRLAAILFRGEQVATALHGALNYATSSKLAKALQADQVLSPLLALNAEAALLRRIFITGHKELTRCV
jgi:alkyl sulfatase BDS1-like metallo-beta-lactamase superfamily hydrolase